MVSTSIQRAVVSTAFTTNLLETLLYGMLIISNIKMINYPLMRVCSGIYAAFYAGTLYLYCNNGEHWSRLFADILNTSFKEIPEELLHSFIYHMLIHSEWWQNNLQLDHA